MFWILAAVVVATIIFVLVMYRPGQQELTETVFNTEFPVRELEYASTPNSTMTHVTSALLDTHLKSLSGKLEEKEKRLRNSRNKVTETERRLNTLWGKNDEVKNKFVVMMEQLKTDLDKTEIECLDLTRQINLISSCREELRKESVKPLMKKSQNDLLTQRLEDFFENAEGCSKEFKNFQRTKDAAKDVKEDDIPNNDVECFKEEFDQYGNVFHNDTIGERSSLWTRLFSLIPNLELLHPVNRCIVCFNAITTVFRNPERILEIIAYDRYYQRSLYIRECTSQNMCVSNEYNTTVVSNAESRKEENILILDNSESIHTSYKAARNESISNSLEHQMNACPLKSIQSAQTYSNINVSDYSFNMVKQIEVKSILYNLLNTKEPSWSNNVEMNEGVLISKYTDVSVLPSTLFDTESIIKISKQGIHKDIKSDQYCNINTHSFSEIEEHVRQSSVLDRNEFSSKKAPHMSYKYDIRVDSNILSKPFEHSSVEKHLSKICHPNNSNAFINPKHLGTPGVAPYENKNGSKLDLQTLGSNVTYPTLDLKPDNMFNNVFYTLFEIPELPILLESEIILYSWTPISQLTILSFYQLYEIPKSSESKELHELDPKEVTNMTEDEIFMNLYHSDLLGGEKSHSETICPNLSSRIIYQIHDLSSVEHIFDFIDLNCGIDVEKESVKFIHNDNILYELYDIVKEGDRNSRNMGDLGQIWNSKNVFKNDEANDYQNHCEFCIDSYNERKCDKRIDKSLLKEMYNYKEGIEHKKDTLISVKPNEEMILKKTYYGSYDVQNTFLLENTGEIYEINMQDSKINEKLIYKIHSLEMIGFASEETRTETISKIDKLPSVKIENSHINKTITYNLPNLEINDFSCEETCKDTTQSTTISPSMNIENGFMNKKLFYKNHNLEMNDFRCEETYKELTPTTKDPIENGPKNKKIIYKFNYLEINDFTCEETSKELKPIAKKPIENIPLNRKVMYKFNHLEINDFACEETSKDLRPTTRYPIENEPINEKVIYKLHVLEMNDFACEGPSTETTPSTIKSPSANIENGTMNEKIIYKLHILELNNFAYEETRKEATPSNAQSPSTNIENVYEDEKVVYGLRNLEMLNFTAEEKYTIVTSSTENVSPANTTAIVKDLKAPKMISDVILPQSLEYHYSNFDVRTSTSTSSICMPHLRDIVVHDELKINNTNYLFKEMFNENLKIQETNGKPNFVLDDLYKKIIKLKESSDNIKQSLKYLDDYSFNLEEDFNVCKRICENTIYNSNMESTTNMLNESSPNIIELDSKKTMLSQNPTSSSLRFIFKNLLNSNNIMYQLYEIPVLEDLPTTDKSHFWKPNTSVENIRKTSSNHNNPYYSYNEDDIAESHHGMMLKAKMKTSREHFDELIPAVLPGPRIFYQLYELPEIDETFDKCVIETTSEEQLKEMINFNTLSETTQDCEVLELVDIHDEPEVLHKKLTSAYVFDSPEEVLRSQFLREHSPNCLSFDTASLDAEFINHSISLGNALENTEDASEGALNNSQYPDWVRGLILDNGKNIPRSFNMSSTLDAIYTTDLANSTSEYFFDILRISNSEILINPEIYQCNRHEKHLGPYQISPERNQVESIYCRQDDRIYKSPVTNDVFYVNDFPKDINSRSLSQPEDIISGFDSTRACLINNNKLSDESDHIINIQGQSSHTESNSDHMSDINPVYKVSGIEKDPGNIYSECPLFKMTSAHHAINSGYPNTHITGDQASQMDVQPLKLYQMMDDTDGLELKFMSQQPICELYSNITSGSTELNKMLTSIFKKNAFEDQPLENESVTKTNIHLLSGERIGQFQEQLLDNSATLSNSFNESFETTKTNLSIFEEGDKISSSDYPKMNNEPIQHNYDAREGIRTTLEAKSKEIINLIDEIIQDTSIALANCEYVEKEKYDHISPYATNVRTNCLQEALDVNVSKENLPLVTVSDKNVVSYIRKVLSQDEIGNDSINNSFF